MARASALAVVIVATYAVIAWADLDLYLVEFALLVATVVGIGAFVAYAGVDRPFLKAAVVSFMTVLCLESLVYIELTVGAPSTRPPVLPHRATMVVLMVASSLMIAGISGAVALAIHGFRDRTDIAR